MNIKPFFLSALVLISIFAIPFSMNGQTKSSPVTWVASAQGYNNSQAVTTFTIEANAIEGLLDKSTGSTAPTYYTANAGVRMYTGNTLSVTPLSGYSLNAIEYIFKKQGSKTYAQSELISDGGTYVAATSPVNGYYTDRWTYDGDYKGTVTIKLTSAAQRVFCQITVTYTGSAGQTYTVSYYPNTALTPQSPVNDPSTYAMGATVTVLSPSNLGITNPGNVFTKWSTSQNGLNGTDYLPGDQFTMGSDDVSLYAQWTSTTGTRIDELTPTVVNAAMENTGYCEWNVTGNSGAIYHGKSFRSENYIQITNSQSGNSQYSGIVTTTSGGTLSRVQVVWNSNTPQGRTLNVYGKNTSYSGTSDLYGNTCGTLLGTVTKGASSTSDLVVSGNVDYNYVGLLSQSGAMYIDNIMVTWTTGGAQTPTILMEPSPIALGNVVLGQPLQATFVVSQANLSTDITLTTTKGTLSPNMVPQDNNPTPITWSYTPDGTQNEFPVTITATSGQTTETLEITAVVLPSSNFTTLHASKAAFLANPSAPEVKINLTDVEVVGQSGNYLYLQDADAGVLIYGSGAPTFETGYKFRQGYLLGTYVSYNGITEITSFSFVGHEGSTGNSLTTTTATVNQILSYPVTYESRYVQIDNTTISNWTLPGRSANLAFYDVFHTNYALCTAPETSHTFTVKGMVNRHWSNSALHVELAPTALSDIITTTLAAAPTITVGGTQAAPVATTYVDITPGTNSTAVYSMWRQNGNAMELVVDNQRITSAVNISITGVTEIKVHGERDFYTNTAEVDYWYDLPANTYSVQFSINGVIDPANNVLVTSTLSPTQAPAVTVVGDFGFLGWSTDPSSTTVIDLSTYQFTQNTILYAVYFRGASFQYVKVSDVANITEGEYIITVTSGSTPYTLENSRTSTSPAAHSISTYGITLSGNQLEPASGQTANYEAISWTFTGTLNAMTIMSVAYPDSWLYTANENTGVRISNNVSGVVEWSIAEDNLTPGLFNLKCNRNDRYLALYNNQDWRSYQTLTAPNSYPRIALYRKTPVVTGNEPKYTRVFWNETATADITISGPSIIPSGYFLKMGEHLMTNANAANFIIEDNACFTPASNNSSIKATVQKDIVGYGSSNIAGWVLLSSPVGTVTPSVFTSDTHVDNMVTGSYDLYGFDQTQSSEWRNNKTDNQTFGAQGGLLYASQNDRTLSYVGNITATVVSSPLTLTYVANADMAGWNLIGNPFTSEGYLVMSEGLTDYLRLEDYVNGNNELESHFVTYTTSDPVAPMEGVFVQATQANQTYYFKNFLREAVHTSAMANMTLTGSNGAVVDKARVRFNNGTMMGKMVFNESNTKLYIPQGGKDYAVVCAQNEGEIPVNFKTRENGSFTLSVSTEDINMEYLHLIDNMTGADIDLLATPSYTFEARVNDYPSRFRLVFSAEENGASTSSAAFAYYDGSSWVVSNPSTGSGAATLQVVDVMGRIVANQQINGNATIGIDMPGVYVLRLVNGNDVKVQKVVVR